ncbi:LysR family transcriptional regulator [Pseudomonas sp. Marseille-QA0892]
MRLRHIEIFQAILQTGSVTGAASLLNISQPAATKALQHAEAQLGFMLFNRIRGQLVPTAEARILEKTTAKVFEELQAARRLAGNLRRHAARALRIVATPSLAQTLLPKVIPEWRELYPEAPCELITHHTPQLIDSLLLHDADIGLTLQDPKHPGLKVRSLAQGHMAVIAPQGRWSEAERVAPLSIDELGQQPLIALDTRDALGALLERHLSESRSEPQIMARVQTWQLARALVSKGMGLAVVDPLTAYGDGPPVQPRALTPALAVNCYAVTRLDEGEAEAPKRLLAMLADVARPLMP